MARFAIEVLAIEADADPGLSLGKVVVTASTEQAAVDMAHAKLWEPRLDSTCNARFKVAVYEPTPHKQRAVDFIRAVAKEQPVSAEIGVGSKSFHVLNVLADGTLALGGYAGDSAPLDTELETLGWEQLGALLDACAELGNVY